MEWKEACRLRLLWDFQGSFFNERDEFIAHRYSNTYFIFGNCETKEDVDCKVLEWLSRSAHKGIPYSQEWRNKKFRQFMLDGINMYLNSNLSWKKLGDTTGNTPISLSPIFDEAKEIQICVKVNNTYDFITTVSTTFLNEFSISHTLEVGGYYGSVSANARASVYFNPSTKDISIVNAYQNGNDLLKNSTLYIYYR